MPSAPEPCQQWWPNRSRSGVLEPDPLQPFDRREADPADPSTTSTFCSRSSHSRVTSSAVAAATTTTRRAAARRHPSASPGWSAKSRRRGVRRPFDRGQRQDHRLRRPYRLDVSSAWASPPGPPGSPVSNSVRSRASSSSVNSAEGSASTRWKKPLQAVIHHAAPRRPPGMNARARASSDSVARTLRPNHAATSATGRSSR